MSRVTDAATTAEYTSHSSLEMVDYYSHASEESMRLAMERMYGEGSEKRLKEIFQKVRSRKMTFDEFMAAIK
jgi:hypothetical protein